MTLRSSHWEIYNHRPEVLYNRVHLSVDTAWLLVAQNNMLLAFSVINDSDKDCILERGSAESFSTSLLLSIWSTFSLLFSPPFINFLSRMTNEAPCIVYLVVVLWGLTQINSLRCALITWTLKSIHCLTQLLSFSTWPAAVKHPAIKLNAQQTCMIHTVIESLSIHNVYMIITVTLPEPNH